MPRAVDPCFGKDGYGLAPLPGFRLYRRQIEPLMGYVAGAPSINLAQMTRYLSEVGTQHRKGADRGASRFTRAQAREALDRTLQQSTISAVEIIRLNERALCAVFDELTLMLPPSQDTFVSELLYSDKISSAVLRAACEMARAKLIKTGGPDADSALYMCTENLCRLYEVITGKSVTLSNKDTCGVYKQVPSSDGAQFVREALILITGRGNAERGVRARSAANRCIEAYIANRAKRTGRTQCAKRSVRTRRTTAQT